MKISPTVRRSLRCPACRSTLDAAGEGFSCACGARYPAVDGVPVLIHEARSVFTIDDFVSRRQTFFKDGALKSFAMRVLPPISLNLRARKNFTRLAASLPAGARVLVVGGSVPGEGIAPLLSKDSFEIVHTDVSLGGLTQLVCDAHDLPFEDACFDAVVLQAVLEHVADPWRCAEEAHRVLKPDGAVYAEVPFMQQVHGEAYDFTRFTHLGLRRLFRRFEEVDSGVCGGPGMALAWAWQYFLLSFARSRAVRAALKVFARLTSFFLLFFDTFLAGNPGAYDAASGVYFMGRKSERTLSDREIAGLFRGARDY